VRSPRRDDSAAGGPRVARKIVARVLDGYVRTTVILASVLFLVGISTHFAVRSVRMSLLALAVVLLVVAAVAVVSLPVPP